jgi:glycine/D-amino acid oxidase-like deaminating enzyme
MSSSSAAASSALPPPTIWRAAAARWRLVEKGVVGGEQSSRNWGWCRKQNRDARELPLAIRAMELWEKLSEELGRDSGFRRCGLVYATNDAAQFAQWERWRETAKAFRCRDHDADRG